MRSNRRILFIAVTAALALVLTAGSMAFASPADDPSAPQRTVSVSGSAKTTLKPDIAYIEVGIYSEKPTVAAAQEDNNTLMQKVFNALKAQGIDVDKDVQTVNYNISPNYGTDGQKIVGFRISNNVRVKVRDLDKMGQMLDAVGTAGANLISGLSFDVEDKEAAYNQAVVNAIADARSRAEALAKSAGATLGAVVSVSESGGYYPPGPIYFARDAMAGAGSVPISQGKLEISANVSITFGLN